MNYLTEIDLDYKEKFWKGFSVLMTKLAMVVDSRFYWRYTETQVYINRSLVKENINNIEFGIGKTLRQ